MVFKFCTHLCICSVIVCGGFEEVETGTKFSSMLHHFVILVKERNCLEGCWE